MGAGQKGEDQAGWGQKSVNLPQGSKIMIAHAVTL